ncbi:hypothetical protein ACFXTN_025980 [Malus domestica]
MAEVLSQFNGVATVCISPKSSKTNLNQVACAVASEALMYSASAVDNATHCCLTEDQEKTPLPKVKAYPDVLFISSSEPLQSLSQNPTKIAPSPFLYSKPKSRVP